MDYKKLLEKYNLLLSENSRLIKENNRLKVQLGILQFNATGNFDIVSIPAEPITVDVTTPIDSFYDVTNASDTGTKIKQTIHVTFQRA
ncbi:MAG: hypothetical protein JW786_15385 [Desulfobacterales bacterium]|nr:hypothetical protein [Desulfobacterales bacterium]